MPAAKDEAVSNLQHWVWAVTKIELESRNLPHSTIATHGPKARPGMTHSKHFSDVEHSWWKLSERCVPNAQAAIH